MKTLALKKGLVLAVLTVTIIGSTKANNGIKVPERVANAFATAYPYAKLKTWTTAKASYKVEFNLNHKRYTAVYASDGSLVKTEIRLSVIRDIPSTIKKALRNGKYASFYIEEIRQIDIADKRKYVLIIDNHNGSTLATEGYGSWENYKLVYNADGKLLTLTEQ